MDIVNKFKLFFILMMLLPTAWSMEAVSLSQNATVKYDKKQEPAILSIYRTEVGRENEIRPEVTEAEKDAYYDYYFDHYFNKYEEIERYKFFNNILEKNNSVIHKTVLGRNRSYAVRRMDGLLNDCINFLQIKELENDDEKLLKKLDQIKNVDLKNKIMPHYLYKKMRQCTGYLYTENYSLKDFEYIFDKTEMEHFATLKKQHIERRYEEIYLTARIGRLLKFLLFANYPKSLIREHANKTGLTVYILNKQKQAGAVLSHEALAVAYFGSYDKWNQSLDQFLDIKENERRVALQLDVSDKSKKAVLSIYRTEEGRGNEILSEVTEKEKEAYYNYRFHLFHDILYLNRFEVSIPEKKPSARTVKLLEGKIDKLLNKCYKLIEKKDFGLSYTGWPLHGFENIDLDEKMKPHIFSGRMGGCSNFLYTTFNYFEYFEYSDDFEYIYSRNLNNYPVLLKRQEVEKLYEKIYIYVREAGLVRKIPTAYYPKSLIRAHADKTGLTSYIFKKQAEAGTFLSHEKLAIAYFGDRGSWMKNFYEFLDAQN